MHTNNAFRHSCSDIEKVPANAMKTLPLDRLSVEIPSYLEEARRLKQIIVFHYFYNKINFLFFIKFIIFLKKSDMKSMFWIQKREFWLRFIRDIQNLEFCMKM